jgi:hypothetical protein
MFPQAFTNPSMMEENLLKSRQQVLSWFCIVDTSDGTHSAEITEEISQYLTQNVL